MHCRAAGGGVCMLHVAPFRRVPLLGRPVMAASSLRLVMGRCFGGRPKLRAVLQPHRGGAMKPIKDAKISIVALELLVVEIVEVGLLVGPKCPREAESRVVDLCADDCAHNPHDGEENMRTKGHKADRERQQVGENEFDRRAVDGHERDGRGEFVVHLRGGSRSYVPGES
eukprot:scaffold31563_cov27-Tisochrysis_lutea.AAC.6